MKEHWIEWSAAYDHSADSRGVHGAEMRWYVRGPEGVAQFVVYTNWMLPQTQARLDSRTDRDFPHLMCHPLPADIGYHSPVAEYEGQEPITPGEPCPLIGVPCYYDGSGLAAADVFKLLVSEGGGAVWAYLDNYYDRTFAATEPVQASMGVEA